MHLWGPKQKYWVLPGTWRRVNGFGPCGWIGMTGSFTALSLAQTDTPIRLVNREDRGVTWWILGTNSLQARNLFIRGCSPSWASLLRECCFWFGNWVGSQDNDNQSSSVSSSRSPLVPHLGVNFVLSVFFCSIGEAIMGSSAVTRSCRTLGAENFKS